MMSDIPGAYDGGDIWVCPSCGSHIHKCDMGEGTYGQEDGPGGEIIEYYLICPVCGYEEY